MNQIILVLKYYDQYRFNEYCCYDHYKIFNHTEINTVMDPPMNVLIQDLASKTIFNKI